MTPETIATPTPVPTPLEIAPAKQLGPSTFPEPDELPYGWVPPPTNLPLEDGEPVETNRHRMAMNTLIRSVQQAYSDRSDFFTGGNMFIYFSNQQVMNKDYRGPDFFVVLGTDGSYSRDAWIVWEEDGHYPDVIVELLSPSTAQQDFGIKKDIYEQTFRTPDYFVFDPYNPDSLQGWHLSDRHYQTLVPDERGWLWCESLGFWLGTWNGTIDCHPGIWLRFYDPAGNLVLLPEEAAQQQAKQAQQEAEQERQLREDLLAKLRARGIDPDTL